MLQQDDEYKKTIRGLVEGIACRQDVFIRIARKWGASEQDAQDAFQQAIANILTSCTYKPERPFDQYFFTAYRNAVRAPLQKKREACRSDPCEDDLCELSPVDTLITRERLLFSLQLFWRCGAYPHKQMAVFLSIDHDGDNQRVAVEYGPRSLYDIADMLLDRMNEDWGGCHPAISTFKGIVVPRLALLVRVIFGHRHNRLCMREDYAHLSQHADEQLGGVRLLDYVSNAGGLPTAVAQWKHEIIQRLCDHVHEWGQDCPVFCRNGSVQCPIKNLDEECPYARK